jgi:PilZ domain
MADDAEQSVNGLFRNNRKNDRNAIKVSARLLVSGGFSFQVQVLDLSATGFRIETANHIAHDRSVYLTLPGMQPLHAKTVWNERELYGCAFSRPLHSSVFSHLSGSYPALMR